MQNREIVETFVEQSVYECQQDFQHIVSPSFLFRANGRKQLNFKQFIKNWTELSAHNKIILGDIKTANQVNYFMDVQLYNRVKKKALAICRFNIKGGMIDGIELNYHPIIGNLREFDADFCIHQAASGKEIAQ